MKPKLYTLKDRQVVEATMEEWSRDRAHRDHIVAQWTLGDVFVSTVFLGLDHRFGGKGPPQFFETMVFEGPCHGHQERCSTWAEAEAQHERVCAMVKARVLQ